MGTVFSASDFADAPGTPVQTAPRQQFSSADFSGDTLPAYANGLDPSRPINESPIDPLDRAKLSVGNEAGKMKWLKERFSDVQRTKSGDVVVKDSDGFYKRIDPNGLGSGDAWSMTKELIGDAADLIKPITAGVAQVGAAAGLAAATGGASLTAQAATSAAVGAAVESGMTSLGRLVGTYDATPEEQLKDIGVEALMNLGGTYVAAGVKPALSYVGQGLAKAGNALSSLTPVARASVTNAIGAATGVGAKPVEFLIDNPEAVKTAMTKAAAGGVGSEEAVTRMGREMIDSAAAIAKSARPTATALYDNLAKEVAANAPETFSSNIGKITSSVLKPIEEQGIGVLNGAGKLVLREADDFAKFVAENAATTGELSALAADKASYNILREAATAIQSYEGAKSLTGSAGAMQVMKFRRILADTTYRLQQEATDAALVPAMGVLSQMKNIADGVINSAFELEKPVVSSITGQETKNLFASMNSVYQETMREIQPMIKAAGQAVKQGHDGPFEALANKLISDSGRNNLTKTSADKAIELTAQRSGALGQEIADAYLNLHANHAARAFTPMLRKSIFSQSAVVGAVGTMLAGNPVGSIGLAGAAAATSPRLSYTAVQAGLKAKAFVSKLSPAQRGALLNSPEAISTWANTISNAVSQHSEVANQLINQGMQQIRGGQ